MSFKKFLEEAKAGRAWNGRLNKIDELLQWMYSNDILNKGEKAQKDALFHQYYRYYNDGDMPRNLSNEFGNRLSKWSGKEKIEVALEMKLEEFIKKILSKYLGKIDRGLVNIDTQIGKLNTVIDVTDMKDIHGLVKYWVKDVNDPDVKAQITGLESKYDALDALTKEACNAYPWEKSYDNPQNTVMTHRREAMQKVKIWTTKMESGWKEIQRNMFDISELLKNLKSSLEKMKQIRLFDKE